MKIFCIGRNYAQHAKELANDLPEEPLVFMKPNSALLKEPYHFYYPNFSTSIHYEVELVLRITKNGKSIRPAFASDYWNEIGLGIDFTARDIQSRLKQKGHPWEIAKGFDQSALISKEFISISDERKEREIRFTLEQNQKMVQSGNSKDMIFDFNTLICHLSKYFTLQKGDLIYTGTPAGVGPVNIGDELVGKLNDKEMFTCQVK